MSFRAAAISSISLLTVASALPSTSTGTGTGTSNEARAWQECPSGTWYSKCYDYDGCYSYDPCVNPSVPATKTGNEARAWQECPTGSWYSKCYDYDGCYNYDPCANPSASPTTTPTPSPTACAAGSMGTSTGRSMHVVLPSDPDYSTGDVGYFQVQQGVMDINEVGVFSGIPADATTCSVRWKQGAVGERSFTVTGNGAVSVVQLGGAFDPAQNVTWAAVEGATALGNELMANMGNWDKPDQGATTHIVGDVQCAEVVSLKFETFKGAGGSTPDESDNYWLEQDDKNGFYITYSC